MNPSGFSRLQTLEATVQVIAPTFVDYNDSAYFVNPNSTSKLYNLEAVDRVISPIYYDRDNLSFYVDPASTSNLYSIIATNSIYSPIYYDRDNPAFYVDPAGTSNLYSAFATNSIYSPIYYDLNSTAYYLDPANTSRLYSVDVIGGLSTGSMYSQVYYDSNDTSYYFDGSSTGDSIRVKGDIVAYYSDERLKDRKGNIENALEKLLSLNGFYYEPNEIAQALGYKKKLEVGVSAQEVEAILPEIIKEAPIGNNFKTLDYSKLVPLLIEAIKEQQNQIDELKRNI